MYKINRVLPIENFKLVLEYSDGVNVVANFIPIIQQGKVFQPLQDPNFFAKVSLDKTGRYIYWEDEIEFCADALSPHSARNGSLKIFTTRQSGFQRFQKKLMIINPISASLLTILK